MADPGARISIGEYLDPEANLATEAFQNAIDACADAGGGTVVVPSGEYEIGTINLRSHVTLSLEAGATVYAAREQSAYGDAYGPDGERPFVRAEDVENVTITGRGVFDGRGTDFHEMDDPLRGHSGESDHHPLIANAPHEARQGEDYLDPSLGTEEWPRAKSAFRPGPMFLLEDATNVRFEGVTLRDMPAWTISLHDCDDVVVCGVTIDNHMRIPNCDGISIMNSRDVRISDCSIRSCDDSITIGTRAEGEDPTAGITVTNCTLASAACAIKFGSETHAPIRDCVFENCVVRDSNRGLGIQHRDAGDLENVLFSNIVVETGLLPGPWWGKAEPIYVTSVPRTEETNLGRIRNVRFSNIVARSENGALVYAHEDADVAAVSLENVRIEIEDSPYADRVGGNVDLQPTAVEAPIAEREIAGVDCEGVRDLELRGIDLEWGTDLPAYYANGIRCTDIRNLEIEGFSGRQAHEDAADAAVALQDVRTVSIRNSRARAGAGTFCSLEGTEDERLFAGNDLVDAGTAIDADGEHGFSEYGNVPPAQ
ncbi:glycoside hydrolase family 28 protein [Halopiger xanaduensis]|uniref:Glycoside hydrolase family 28 n=1 Tax=Halopiger xanaduensis (strain DSM 18323 / JCM 14033 / SH-6) TaxID=797210 RepID=F8DDH0_HALXS|nr:glycosyl hydrolase family 28 protein [Halopiger xanaduensis]AEH39064.1 glycoside hydrolase family 28 [Halopiger xanaduensis SH-6]